MRQALGFRCGQISFPVGESIGFDLSFGVEEESLVVDPLSRAVVPAAAAVIWRARAGLGDRVAPEITHMQVEVRTEPCVTAAGLHGQVHGGRAEPA